MYAFIFFESPNDLKPRMIENDRAQLRSFLDGNLQHPLGILHLSRLNQLHRQRHPQQREIAEPNDRKLIDGRRAACWLLP